MYSKNDYRNYLEDDRIYSDDFLMHYGVKGMKWKNHNYVIDPRLRERMARGLSSGRSMFNRGANGITSRVNGARRQMHAMQRRAKLRRAINRSPIGSLRRDIRSAQRRRAINKAMGSISDRFNRAGGSAMNKARSMQRRLKTKAAIGGTKLAVKGATKALTSKTGRTLAKAAIKRKANKFAKDTFSGLIDKKALRKKQLSNAAGQVKSKASSAANRVASNPNVQKAKTAARKAGNKAMAKTSNTARKVTSCQEFQSAKVAAKKARNKAMAKASNTARKVASSQEFQSAKVAAKKTRNKMRAKAERYGKAVRSEAGKAYSSTKVDAKKTYNKARAKASNAYGRAKKKVNSTVSKAQARRATNRLRSRNW